MNRLLMAGCLMGCLAVANPACAEDAAPPAAQSPLLRPAKHRRVAPLESQANGETQTNSETQARPAPTFLLAVHNLEPWFTPPGEATDLLWDRSALTAPPIMKQADK